MLEEQVLYYLLFGACVYWTNFILCDLSLKKAISKVVTYIIVIIFFGGLVALYYFTSFKTMVFVEYIIGFLPFIFIPLLYKDSVAKIIFTYFSGMLFSLMLHLTSNIVTNLSFEEVVKLDLIPNLTADRLFHIITLGFMLIYLLIIVFGLKKVFKKMLSMISNKTIGVTCLFPIAAFIILLVDYIMLSDLTTMNANMIALLTLMLLILLIYIILFVSFTKNGSFTNTKNAKGANSTPAKKEVISDPADLLASARHYYEMILNHYLEMNNRTSTLDSQLSTMNSFLLNDNVAGATVFMDRISQTFHDHELTPVCNNQSLNLLLSYYIFQCRKENIYIETHIDMPAHSPIPDLDLCIIFGSCIENAIEACRFIKNPQDRFINIDCKIQNGCVMMILDNSFDGFINKVNNQLKTRKKFGGIGLKTVQSVVSKYRGTIEIEYPQNVFSIFVKLQLNPQNTNNQTMHPFPSNSVANPKKRKSAA